MVKYKVEHVIHREDIDGSIVEKERYNIYRRLFIGWKYMDYRPSQSLIRKFMKSLGEREWLYVELT